MEDVVAVAVVLTNGQRRFFLTWGRVQHPVDSHQLEGEVLKHAPGYDLGGKVARAHICRTLQEARRQPYFYEGLYWLATVRGAAARSPRRWRASIAGLMKRGRAFYYLGRPPDRRKASKPVSRREKQS